MGIDTIVVKKLHSKIVIIDKNILCVGSFSWFSALRHGDYAKHETSFVYKGAKLDKEIDILIASFDQLQGL